MKGDILNKYLDNSKDNTKIIGFFIMYVFDICCAFSE